MLPPTARGAATRERQAARCSTASVSIHESGITTGKFTPLVTLVLVVVVIFLFLQASLSATVIPSLAMPMSTVGTFAVCTCSAIADNLSLMALPPCRFGFVVDDAIVMLENTRHMEMGKSAFQAALDGAAGSVVHDRA